MESYIFKYGIAGADIPTDLRLVFLQEHPWIDTFAVVRNKEIDIASDGKDYDTMFNGVILGLGELSSTGKDGNGAPIFNIQYEIIGCPPDLENVFQDVVAGKGEIFDKLRKLVDALVSSFITEIYNESIAEQSAPKISLDTTLPKKEKS
jgi:hypothetical protein